MKKKQTNLIKLTQKILQALYDHTTLPLEECGVITKKVLHEVDKRVGSDMFHEDYNDFVHKQADEEADRLHDELKDNLI